MSSRPKSIQSLYLKSKCSDRKMVLVTCYDALTAKMLSRLSIDSVLVGDSLATVLLGYGSTRDIRIEEFNTFVEAVLRSRGKVPVIVDIPFKLMKQGPASVLHYSKKLRRLKADAIKIEWSPKSCETTSLCVKQGIPVMGHVGLTPQSFSKEKILKVQGQTALQAKAILKQAQRFEQAGAFSIVLECIPQELSEIISKRLNIPTIGIGAGIHCDGQVLVYQDIVGLTQGFSPRFVKNFAQLQNKHQKGVESFIRNVRSGRFPGKKNSYRMPKIEWKQIKTSLL